ncbi:MAG: type II toxin-antitoxin system prevent-host-death family antitoxin [Armatimonadota bacterium]|nr:type II toxin-antitoxin system prevent-host-death family antitoxin [Armatimonadota bacterium]
MGARTVGIREAKARLSRLVDEVSRGREWIITARGKPVARLAPVTPASLSLAQRIKQLEDAGVLEPARPAEPLPPPLPLRRGLALRWLQEARSRWDLPRRRLWGERSP